MKELISSCGRAAVYCLHPRVIWLSLLPLVLSGLLALLLGWLYWESAVTAMRAQLEAWALIDGALDWLSAIGLGGLRAMLAPLIVVVLAVPVLVVLSLLIVAVFLMPKLVDLVAARRFPSLERRHSEPFWRSVLASLGATLAALGALLITVPLWLIPPLVLLLPPLIWGWLTYRVMSFDALAEHATREERQRILVEHRLPLLGIGVLSGYLGAAPTLVWAVSALTLAFAPVLIVFSVWLYTLVFAFSALWFIHYALGALEAMRAQDPLRAPVIAPAGEVIDALPPP